MSERHGIWRESTGWNARLEDKSILPLTNGFNKFLTKVIIFVNWWKSIISIKQSAFRWGNKILQEDKEKNMVREGVDKSNDKGEIKKRNDSLVAQK